MKRYFQSKLEIFERIQWLIKLRWVVVACAFMTICMVEMLAPLEFAAIPYCLVIAFVAGCNLAYAFYTESMSVEDDELKAKRLANVQVSVDLVALTLIVYLTGGIESPFVFFYVFHMITAGILLSTRASYLQAALASTLSTSVIFLEYFSILPHRGLTILHPLSHGLYLDERYIITMVIELIIVFFLIVYLTNYLSGLLHKKQEGIRELSTLLDIGKLLGSTLKLDVILDLILNTAISETGTFAGSVALFDEEKGELNIRASKGFSEEFLNKTLKWKVRKGGMTDAILKGGKPLVIENASEEAFFDSQLLLDEGIKSLIAVPLFTEDRIVGILYVDDFKPRKFTESEVRLVSIFATQAAIAIDNAQLHEKTKELAIMDGLTGIYNHRHFRETLENEIMRADRYHHPSSLTLIDVDNFKDFNDSYGHLEGDILLTSIADLLTKYTREMDMVARYGGDEFAIISPEIDKERAFEMAGRVKIEVVDNFLKKRGMYASVKISLGVASFPCDAVSVDDLIRKADLALYKAKGAKKNKVCAFTPQLLMSR